MTWHLVSNPESKMTGWPIGFWAAEMVHPWYAFREVGYEVALASPDGGKVQIDGLSDPRDDLKVSGSYLIEGRTITGFSNVEEDASNEAAGMTVQPWRIEDAARERGANYVEGRLWKPFAVRDGRPDHGPAAVLGN